MVRDEMLERMTSRELSGWWVLFTVRHEEAEDAHLRASSRDGQVIISGRDDDFEDDEEEDPGGE